MWGTVHERQQLFATSYVGIASYTFLIYDHLLTFADEVEYIWKGRKGPIIYLFFFNRYFFPLAFIANLYAYISREFNQEVCERFVRYEGATAIVAVGVVGLMMFLRVNALYGGRCRIVQAILSILWLAQVGIYAWLLSKGKPVRHAHGIHSCSLVFDPHKLGAATLSAVAPLVFETAVVILTLYKSLGTFRKTGSGWTSGISLSNTLMKVIVTDGVLYYIAVFCANLAWAIMIVTAPIGIKNILGQFVQLTAVTMMSRITLHLRKVGAKRNSTVIMPNSSLLPPSYYYESSAVGSKCTTESSDISFADPKSVMVGEVDSEPSTQSPMSANVADSRRQENNKAVEEDSNCGSDSSLSVTSNSVHRSGLPTWS